MSLNGPRSWQFKPSVSFLLLDPNTVGADSASGKSAVCKKLQLQPVMDPGAVFSVLTVVKAPGHTASPC